MTFIFSFSDTVVSPICDTRLWYHNHPLATRVHAVGTSSRLLISRHTHYDSSTGLCVVYHSTGLNMESSVQISSLSKLEGKYTSWYMELCSQIRNKWPGNVVLTTKNSKVVKNRYLRPRLSGEMAYLIQWFGSVWAWLVQFIHPLLQWTLIKK